MVHSRRQFLHSLSLLTLGSALPVTAFSFGKPDKLRVCLVGTGIRGITFWGRRLVDNYSDVLEFAGLSDINPGRLEYGRNYIGVDCPVYTDFDEMLKTADPDLLIVATKDSTHHEFIVKGLDYGCDVITEKPLTTDERKCQEIIDAERRSPKNLIVGFNYRWSSYSTRIKELLSNGSIGKITSVDFHWYLNTYHGASYFRRWHGLRQAGGTLWVHKATHHFDLLNWWINSDPEEVYAYGDLEYYGTNGPFRGENCRKCPHKGECDFYWDITGNDFLRQLYVDHEHHDGYIRDNCLFRPEINIYDKMSAQVKYRNNVIVNYSLTTYSPFEGWRVAFNGTEGRIEASWDIPYNETRNIEQEELHALEMDQSGDEQQRYEPVIVHQLWNDFEVVPVPVQSGGHGGGDERLQDNFFRPDEADDSFDRAAGIRDGVMSILVGIAARKSIESGQPVRIAELTDMQPREKRI